MAENKPVKNRTKKLLSRVLSVILVIAMVSGVVLYRVTDVDLSGDRKTEAEILAARMLLADSSYANAPRLVRMRMFMQSYLGRPDSYEDYVQAGDIFIARGRYEEAVDMALDGVLCARTEEEKGRMYLRAGLLYTLTGEREPALEYLEKALERIKEPEAYLVCVQLKKDGGDTDGAIEDLKRFMSDEPDRESLSQAAGMALGLKDYANAGTLYAMDYEYRHNNETLLLQGYCQCMNGNGEEGEKTLRRYLFLGGRDCVSYVLLAKGAMGRKDFAEAKKLLNEAAGSENRNDRILSYYMAECEFELGSYEACERACEACLNANAAGSSSGALKLELSVPEWEIWELRARAETLMGETEKAESSWTECLSYQPRYAPAYYQRGLCRESLGRTEEAKNDYLQAIDLTGSDEIRRMAQESLDGLAE